VAADSLPPLVAGSAPPLFVVSLEAAPPVALLSDAPLSLPPLEDSSPLPLDSSPEAVEDVPSLDLVVEVLEVEVVCTAAASALVSVGGVMSGVLFGTASLTLLPPPQAARLTEHSSTMLAAIVARAEAFN
jgi:hypothetical protein